MRVFGVSLDDAGSELVGQFVRQGIVAVPPRPAAAWNKYDAIQRMERNDLVYMRTSAPGVPSSVEAVGIVCDDEPHSVRGPAVVRSVRWMWVNPNPIGPREPNWPRPRYSIFEMLDESMARYFFGLFGKAFRGRDSGPGDYGLN